MRYVNICQELSIDQTTDHSGAQNDAESSPMHQLSDSGTVLVSPHPTSPQPSFFNPRPSPACQPSTADDFDWEQVEIPESPGALLASSAAHVPSCQNSAASAAIVEAVAVCANGDSSGEELQGQGQEQDGRPKSKTGRHATEPAVVSLPADSLTLRSRRPQCGFWSLA